MAQELKVYRDPKEGPCWREFYEKSEVDAVLAEKDAEIRRLKRALYKACANWAHYVKDILFRDEHEAEKWSKMETKCLAKVEQYK